MSRFLLVWLVGCMFTMGAVGKSEKWDTARREDTGSALWAIIAFWPLILGDLVQFDEDAATDKEAKQ